MTRALFRRFRVTLLVLLMDLARTQQLLARAAILADAARTRLERSAYLLQSPTLAWYRPEPSAPASVILLSRGTRLDQRDSHPQPA